MGEPATKHVTMCLQQMKDGDGSAADRLLPHIYGELRGLAENVFREQWRNHTLQPTALVHEAYMKLVAPHEAPQWENKRHFLRVAAKAMRQVLTDYARSRGAQKREGGRQRIELDDAVDGKSSEASAPLDLIVLDDALTELEQLDERQARIVELRFLAGLSVPETADALGISERTVFLDWNMARSWLERKL